ncbi:hypothetical protein [Yoonia vestfoldensis]|jgi:hypothetical protein|uniref:hypothetical protein n=1 Tax=Yoonia vestfoldensis TaxID=245188 RepID=UPI000376D19D|nr:hypothetical protein [Yoonia vestfoldensis]
MPDRTGKAVENTHALDAFISARCEIDAMLERLMRFSADQFALNPDEVHRGHVGRLAYYASLLRQITDSAFDEVEQAG